MRLPRIPDGLYSVRPILFGWINARVYIPTYKYTPLSLFLQNQIAAREGGGNRGL